MSTAASTRPPTASIAAASSGLRRTARSSSGVTDLSSRTMSKALLIIDFQNDFTSGGALAVPDGDAIAPRVNELVDSGDFDLVVATRDWHPADHASFREQGAPWPPHCVQGTPGAELNGALHADRVDAIVDAGYRADLEGYSGFEATNLAALLRDRGV